MMSISSPSSLGEVLMKKVDGICDDERACRAERADSGSLHLAMIIYSSLENIEAQLACRGAPAALMERSGKRCGLCWVLC